MEEKKRFSIRREEFPEFMRGIGNLIFYMQDNDASNDAIFALESALLYAADDLQRYLEETEKEEFAPIKQKGDKTA